MTALRVGLVGAGPWAEAVHAPALAAHARTELAGVWARRPEAAAAIAKRFGGAVYEKVDDLIADVEAVAFAVPPAVQGALAVQAAAAGRHLLCEKPLADTAAAARAVVDAAEAAGVVTAVMLTQRLDPDIEEWLAGLPDGDAGPDTVGLGRWLSGSLLGGRYAGSAWRQEHGALLDVGPHVIDLLDAALGRVTRVAWAHRDEPDLWRFALDHAGGAHSSVTISMRIPIVPSEIEFGVFGGIGDHRLSARAADPVACYGRLLDSFAAAVAGDGPAPVLDVARALHLQEVIEQVQAAVR
ncbi:MAG: Gfo/Idh/MocA family protein [Pseudonocardia sp.]